MEPSAAASASASVEPSGDRNGQEARSQVLSNAIAAVALHKPVEPEKKPKKRLRQSDREKFESVYSDVDAINECVQLMDAVGLYLASISNLHQNKIASDCVVLATTHITSRLNSIRRVIDNTKVQAQSRQAHAKVSADEKRRKKQQRQQMQMDMRNNPGRQLQTAFTYAQEILIGPGRKSPPENECRVNQPVSGTNADPLSVLANLAAEQLPINQEQPNKRPKFFNIVLLPPADGIMYTPKEALTIIHETESKLEILSGTRNLNTQRSYLRAFKEKMLESYIPIKMSALNTMIQKYGNFDRPLPDGWDERGRKAYMSIDQLAAIQQETQQARVGKGWEKDDTKKAVLTAAKQTMIQQGLDPNTKKSIDRKTQQAYHTALSLLPGNKVLSSKPKPVHREVAETSQRAMLSNAAGIIAARCMILQPNEVHHMIKFDESTALPGVLRARDMMAKAAGVRPQDVYFSPQELLTNVDDKAVIYTGSLPNDKDSSELVIVHESAMHQNYDVHNSKDNSKDLRGVKGRFTNLVCAGGQLGTLWLQIVGFTEKEMPNSKDGVIVIPVPGLTPNGNINPNADTIGYLVLLRNGQAAETNMFKKFEELVRKPTVDAIKRKLGVDPENPPTWCRGVHTMDGGITQLNATKDVESLESKDLRNEIQAKLAKNTSAVFQPCDRGKMHPLQGHYSKKLDKKYLPVIGLVDPVTALIEEQRDLGNLVITSEKRDYIVELTSKYPTICGKSFDEHKMINSFQDPGWVDSNQQGVDIDQMYLSYKGKRTPEMTEKWDRDMPEFIKDMLEHGRVREETFDLLGYPVDTDACGNEYPLSQNIVTQPSRQRFIIMNNEKMKDAFRRAEAAKFVGRELSTADTAEEVRWRNDVLEKNETVERAIHKFFKRDLNSSSELFVTDEAVPISVLAKRGMPIESFVRARKMTSRNDKSFVPPKAKGKTNMLNEYLAKKEADPEFELTSEHRTWLVLAHMCYRDRVILTSTIDEDERDAEEESSTTADPTDSDAVDDDNTNAANEDIALPLAENEALLNEASRCLVGCNVQTKFIPSIGKRIDAVIPKIKDRFTFYKRTELPDSPEFQHSWVCAAFEENLGACCSILGVTKQINPRVVAATFNDCLLSAQSSIGLYPKVIGDENLQDMQGLSLYYDIQKSAFVCVMSAYGKDKSFLKQYTDDSKASKNYSTNAFSRAYPHSEPINPEMGGWSGLFGDLTLHIGIGIKTSCSDCLIRTDGSGIFVWSERTLAKLRGGCSNEAEVKAKQIQLILCMLKLTYELMMDPRALVKSTPFQQFIGKTLGLRSANV